MKTTLLKQSIAISLLFIAQQLFAASPNLGTAANFVLFSTNGAVSNTGLTHLTGNVGTNNGSSTAFGNVDGGMHDNDGVSAKCASDLLICYNELNATVSTFFPAPLLGNGQVLIAGIYAVSGSATLDNILILDGQNNANAEFIIKIGGSFSTGAFSQVMLINGAKACNVFWKIEGLVSIATGSKLVGTIIANNSAINIYKGAELQGRALSTAGAITVDGILAYTPIGCGSTILTGPNAPELGSLKCFALFSASGSVVNTGVSTVKGDIGTNVGGTSGFDTINSTGVIHPIPNVATAIAAVDLLAAYNYLNNLNYDIKLLYPALLGSNLVLTPHTYWMQGAAVLTDSLYLNAQGNKDAVFVIKINGAFSTSTYSKIILINGAQAKNVFWKVEGAVAINEYSEFKGTLIANAGAISLKSSVKLEGSAFATVGTITTAAINASASNSCIITPNNAPEKMLFATIYPNPMGKRTMVSINDASANNTSELKIYNSMGKLIINYLITDSRTIIETNFPAGVYFYSLTSKNNITQTGKLISK